MMASKKLFVLLVVTFAITIATAQESGKTTRQDSDVGSSTANVPEPTTEPSQPTAATPRATHGIEEIVVTARKREESLQNVPVAVTAISEEQLSRYNVVDLSKVAQMTPQLFVSEGPGANGGAITIRGIGSNSTTAGFDQAVSINLDGLQYDRGYVLSQGYFDLARVEVLKGPQALFFGKNSSAGVMSLTSADPGPERELIGRYGHEFRANENFYEAIASAPITDTLGARIAARYSTLGGFIKNLAPATTDTTGRSVPAPARRDWPGKDEFLGRLTLRYEPTRDLEVKLKIGGAMHKADGITQSLEVFSCQELGNQAQLDPGENCKQDWKVRNNDPPRELAATDSMYNEEKGRPYANYNAYNIAAAVNYNLGVSQLTSVTGSYHFSEHHMGDYDFTAIPLVFSAEDTAERSLSEELRLLTSFDFPANFMLGGYYQKGRLYYRHDVQLAPLPQDPATGQYVTFDKHSPTDGQTGSAFGQLMWNVTKTLEFAPGVRYSRVTKDSFVVDDYVHPAAAALFYPAGQAIVDKFSDDDISPEIPLTWRPELWPDTDLTLYVVYKQGFKAGGFSNTGILRSNNVPEDFRFGSEKVSGYEGGLKSTWFNRALLFNVVGYNYKFKDLQVNFFDSANFSFKTQNAASVPTTGTEAELQWIPPLEGLSLHGSLSYNVARYDKFLSFCYAGQTNAQGCNLDANGQPTTGQGARQDLGGTVRPIAPRWTAGMGFLYERPLFDLYKHPISLGVTADSSYADHYLLSPLGRRLFQDSFFRTDASLRLFEPESWWEVSLFGRNLSNEYIVSIESIEIPLSGSPSGAPAGLFADEIGVAGRPREFGLQVTARF